MPSLHLKPSKNHVANDNNAVKVYSRSEPARLVCTRYPLIRTFWLQKCQKPSNKMHYRWERTVSVIMNTAFSRKLWNVGEVPCHTVLFTAKFKLNPWDSSTPEVTAPGNDVKNCLSTPVWQWAKQAPCISNGNGRSNGSPVIHLTRS